MCKSPLHHSTLSLYHNRSLCSDSLSDMRRYVSKIENIWMLIICNLYVSWTWPRLSSAPLEQYIARLLMLSTETSLALKSSGEPSISMSTLTTTKFYSKPLLKMISKDTWNMSPVIFTSMDALVHGSSWHSNPGLPQLAVEEALSQKPRLVSKDGSVGPDHLASLFIAAKWYQ